MPTEDLGLSCRCARSCLLFVTEREEGGVLIGLESCCDALAGRADDGVQTQVIYLSSERRIACNVQYSVMRVGLHG